MAYPVGGVCDTEAGICHGAGLLQFTLKFEWDGPPMGTLDAPPGQNVICDITQFCLSFPPFATSFPLFLSYWDWDHHLPLNRPKSCIDIWKLLENILFLAG